ncbi:hypothetical protein K2173_021438 [Erythroxylum novogranatense]|uniref:Carbohydrate-binding-like fold protein n=1 Tax=Erythroxylum novogranatense TaxID=1862640 RepID=A0AAV8TWB0_9ROSI|nr:hypothetical protein K2173_021438 [Erythroxylum novogranatense]
MDHWLHIIVFSSSSLIPTWDIHPPCSRTSKKFLQPALTISGSTSISSFLNDSKSTCLPNIMASSIGWMFERIGKIYHVAILKKDCSNKEDVFLPLRTHNALSLSVGFLSFSTVGPPPLLASLSNNVYKLYHYSTSNCSLFYAVGGWKWSYIVSNLFHSLRILSKSPFFLLPVTSNQYTIEARKEHYKFDNLKDYMVLPNMALITDIRSIYYDVCGVVRMVNTGYRVKVALTHGPENVKPQARQTDANGNFCFEVPSGEYRLAASPTTATELLFLPPYIDVVVKSPVLNVEFSQALVNVIGSVNCKEKCGPSVSVTLLSLSGKDKERKSVSLTDASDEFVFPNILPGKYRLEVKHNSFGAMPGEDNWCWEQSFIDVDVGIEDVRGIVFVQRGYWVNVISTHDVDAYMTQPDGSPITLKIMKGSQCLCLEYPGVHELHFVNSCISFGSMSTKIDTSNLMPIHLKGEKYLLRGQIMVDLSSAVVANELPNNIPIDIVDGEGSLIDSTAATIALSTSDQMHSAVYEYSVWSTLGAKQIFIPQDSRNDREQILFYPREHQTGLYLEGSALLLFRYYSTRKDIQDLRLPFGVDGHFVGGPLYDDISYTIEASKPGYHLKRVGPHSFLMSQIYMRVYSKDDANKPIPSVLFSLSGDGGYRNNSISGLWWDIFFDNLFLEFSTYAFSPSAETIELGYRDYCRSYFPCYPCCIWCGHSFMQSTKEGVTIEAGRFKGYYEETSGDSSSEVTVRGLVPKATYAIKILKRMAGSLIERASPDSITLKQSILCPLGPNIYIAFVFSLPISTTYRVLMISFFYGEENSFFFGDLYISNSYYVKYYFNTLTVTVSLFSLNLSPYNSYNFDFSYGQNNPTCSYPHLKYTYPSTNAITFATEVRLVSFLDH